YAITKVTIGEEPFKSRWSPTSSSVFYHCPKSKKREEDLKSLSTFTQDATISVYVFCPYWIVNKTGLPIKIKIKISFQGSKHKMIVEGGGAEEILLFNFKKNYPHKILAKHSLSTLKADFYRSESKDGCGLYHPTKIISLMPYFLVKNSTSKAIMYMQESDKNGLWFDIGPN
ncbi:hypothetical protein Avbf_09560, partial [Armadillidium vulgare]